MKTRICFVVQAYGLEVNGGAETHCRLLAEKMLSRYPDIHVLTTKAIDYITWKNRYRAKEETLNGVKVHRFSVKHPRKIRNWTKIDTRFLEGETFDSETERKWLEEQGPYCPALIKYIRKHKDEFDAFVFFTYLYYPTVMGIPEIAKKAILIPLAHENDRYFLKMNILDNVFRLPRAFFFNTDAERIFIQQKYNNQNIQWDVGGVGIDISTISKHDRQGCRNSNKIIDGGGYDVSPYIIYVGRITEAKGCQDLFNYFWVYKRRNPQMAHLRLVLVGKEFMPIPKNDDIVSIGFVSEQTKFDAIANAEVLVLPSKFESLSMVVLEAMALKTNVMMNGDCSVLRDHCIKSNGAFFYHDYFEFEGQLNWILNPAHSDARKKMKDNAYNYVQNNYQWSVICDRLQKLIENM